ncbi:hypothetical protein I317_07308 [Kwoniella heveanensis CBS 569]|uniref:Uncharacterized protein n=1 Tax=Kwoniella heveanensis BCC8398 TaxID=1296120 RepID=A0A1B9GKH6_9TREE|nr:hypothetical protein I316_06758 [Kwoniella heveanensis BCC8398]OCF38894.1 hypothetical protein I317_07308 [Kwoniella heveanensis CBS 569]
MSPETPNGHAEDVPLETPGAGPSRLSMSTDSTIDAATDEEEQDRLSFLKKRAEYLELEQSVDSSNELLSSLASYLSTFQNDLSDVSGQIADLQGRSSEIESQLKGRKTILPPLNALLSDITLPPALVLTLRDTLPAQNPDLWLSAIIQLDEKIALINSRGKVKAISELQPIIDGLKVKALTVLPPFLLSLIRPLKSASKGLSTNLAVLQTSLLLKYQPFYAFLVRQSPRIAKQVERGYVNAARAYYETGVRRYARSLGVIKTRTIEKADLIGAVTSDAAQAVFNKSAPAQKQAYDRLKFKDLDIEGEDGAVVLGYMADDKDFRSPVEALFRSLSLVLLDNASAEFTFIVRFFARSTSDTAPPPSTSVSTPVPPVRSPMETPLDSPNPSFVDLMSDAGRSSAPPTKSKRRGVNEINESLKDAERIWHEVFDSALESFTGFFQTIITPSPPPAIPLLTMIRLNDHLLYVADSRGAIPLLSYLTGWKMALWPIYRKEMDAHVDSLKRLADEAEGKGLAGLMGRGVKDGTVREVAKRYGVMFSCVTALSQEAEEAMIFSSMIRLRSELTRLITTQANKIKSLPERHSFLSSLYEIIMHELVSGPGMTTHPKLQSELSYFRTREEEARRRISAGASR